MNEWMDEEYRECSNERKYGVMIKNRIEINPDLIEYLIRVAASLNKYQEFYSILLFFPMLCHAMPCDAMPCHPIPCHPIPCYFVPCHAMRG